MVDDNPALGSLDQHIHPTGDDTPTLSRVDERTLGEHPARAEALLHVRPEAPIRKPDLGILRTLVRSSFDRAMMLLLYIQVNM